MKWVEFFVPSAPQNLQAAAGIRQVALTWESPNDDGGSSITGYNIYRSTTSGGETLLTSVGSVLAYNDTSVASIQTYYYRISAVNIAGESTQSNEASATTPSAVPGAPLNLQAAAGNTQVTLTWQTPADNGGSPITNYLVYQGTTSGGETLLATLGNVSTYTDTGLSNGQIYYYKVSAINDIGPGSNSTEASATPATVPDAPQYLLAGAGASRVTLNWTAPGYNGGSPITNYRIYRGTTTGGESLLTTLGNVSTFTDYGLTNSQTYYYTVAAVNVMGNSSHSNEVYATPFNVPAVLATASLTPHYVTEWNTYTFRVSYYDEDNIAPAYVNLVVLKEGVAYGSFPMSKTTPSDVNYMDGASYTLSRLFEIGTYQYYFEANDTVFIARYPATTYFEDLIITPAETPIFDGLYYNYNVGMYMGAWGEGTVRYTRVSDTTYNCSERYYYYNPYLGGSTTYSWNIVDIHTRVILSSISSANVGHKDHNVIWNNTRIGTTTEMDGNNIPYGTFPCVGSSFISALSRSISCWKFESGANSLYFERKTGLLIYTFNNLGGGYTITKTITSTNLVLNDYPVASGGGALNNTAVPQNSTSINIDWVITDTVGGTGTYQVLINGTPYVSWTSWTSGSHFYIPVDTNRGCAIFEYTLQYQDMYGLFGTEINVVIEVYQAPLSNHPSDAVFLQGSPEDNITWILTDDVGAGWYHVLRNNEEIVAWTEWVIGTEINVTVQTSLAIGFWNYTIQFNNSAGRFGAQDTVNVTIDDLPIVSDCMYSAQVPQNSTSTITWVLSDQIGAGNYTLLVDDVPVPYLTNIPWANNTDITIPIDTNHGLGTFEYTLQFCDSNGFEGVESSVLIEICGIPQSTHPDDLVFLQGAPADNITWILTDEDGAGWYHVLRNGEEIVAWTTWTIGAEINVTVQTGLAVGYWNYTIQFNNTGGWFGVQDTVNVTIDDFPNVLESPIATQVPQNSTSTITWVLSDQIGAGNYTLLVDDVPVPYLTNIPWANNTDITIPIDTNHGLGTFEYTLQFCDSNGFEGVESSVSIEVYEIPQSNQPGDLEFLQGAPADNITWILTDELGAGWYHVLLNDAEILTWTTWTNGGEINVTVQTNLAVGYWNYTIQFNNSAGRFGDQDTVNVTIDDLPVVSSCPSAAEVVQNALTTITWVFTDQIGAGTYSLFVNDVAVPGKINIPWSNNTGITITVTTSVVGKFNYTLRFCDSNGFEGAASSVLITVVASGDGGGTQPPDFPVEIVVILIIAAAGAMVAVLFVIRAKRKKRGNYPIV